MTALANPKDMTQIPVRALLAYAARCARRVQPLYSIDGIHPEEVACREAMDGAICLAEGFAAGMDIDRASVSRVESGTVRALLLASEVENTNRVAAYAANCAYAVIAATTAAIEAAYADDPTAAAQNVADSATIATEAAIAADASIERAARLDWEMLHRMQLGRFPDLGEPIDPTESGILGPLTTRPARSKGRRSSGASSRPSGNDHSSQAAAGSAESGEAEGLQQLKQELQAEQQKLQTQLEELQAAEQRFREQREAFELELQRADDGQAGAANGPSDETPLREELERERTQWESERSQFEAELQTLRAERDALDEEQRRMREELERLGQSTDDLDSRERQLEELRRQLESDRGEWEAERERIEVQRTELLHEQQSLESAAEALKADRELFEEQRQSSDLDADALQERRKQWEADLAQWAEERSQLQAQRDELRGEEGELNAAKTALEAAQHELEEKQSEFDAARRELEQLRTDLESERAELDERKAELDRQSQQLQSRERELEQAAGELEEQRKQQAAAEHDSGSRPQGTTPPAPDQPSSGVGSVSALHVLVSQLQQERQQLQAERARLVEQFSLLKAQSEKRASAGAVPAAKSRQKPVSACGKAANVLRIVLELGTSRSSQLSVLLQEMSELYRKLGGPGIQFTLNDRRLLPSSNDARDIASRTAADRCFVEILAKPAKRSEGQSSRDYAHWERFISCLCSSLKLSGGLSDYFELAEIAPSHHQSYRVMADAIEQAVEAAREYANDTLSDASGHSIDAVNRQLWRIEELRKRMERDQAFGIELIPCHEEEPVTAADKQSSPQVSRRRRRFRLSRRTMIALTVAAVALVSALYALI